MGHLSPARANFLLHHGNHSCSATLLPSFRRHRQAAAATASDATLLPHCHYCRAAAASIAALPLPLPPLCHRAARHRRAVADTAVPFIFVVLIVAVIVVVSVTIAAAAFS